MFSSNKFFLPSKCWLALNLAVETSDLTPRLALETSDLILNLAVSHIVTEPGSIEHTSKKLF